MDTIADTHKFIDQLSHDGTFSQQQAERLKDVFSDQLQVVTKGELDRAIQRVTIQYLLAMLSQTALILAGVALIFGS